MITTVKLINIISHSCHFVCVCVCVCVMRALEIYSLRKFPIHNTILLTIVTMLYIISLGLFFLHNCILVLFDQHFSISPAFLPLVMAILFSASVYLTLLDSTYKCDHAVLFFLSDLFHIFIMSSRFIHIVANGRFCFVSLATICSMWNLSSPTRDGTRAPSSGSAES